MFLLADIEQDLIKAWTTEKPPSKCNTCTGLEFNSLEINACHCNPDLWWDGESCVVRSQCPCMVGLIP